MPIHPDRQSGRRAMIAIVSLGVIMLLVGFAGMEASEVLNFLWKLSISLAGSEVAAWLFAGISMCVTLVAWLVYYLFRIYELVLWSLIATGVAALANVPFLIGNTLGMMGFVILIPLVSIALIIKLYREHGPTPPPIFSYENWKPKKCSCCTGACE